jgi:hypothetical protein
MTTTLRLTGNTYPIRENLKREGWTWNAVLHCWTQDFAGDWTAPISTEKARTIHASKKGCRLLADMGDQPAVEIWRSESYVAKGGEGAEVHICADCGDLVPCRKTPRGWVCYDCR